jgi:chromosome segregation ATPase
MQSKVEEAAGGAFYSAEDKALSDQSGNPISYYVDDLKDSWRSLRFYIFPRSIATSPANDLHEASHSPPAELDALARTNEQLRERCINIVNRAEDLLVLRNEFAEVFGEVGKILKNTEGTSASLAQRSAMLALEEEEHGALKARYRALHDENETNRSENSVLQGEIQRYGELVTSRETRIQGLEAELMAEKGKAAAFLNALEQERVTANLALEKLQAALAEIHNNEALIGTLQTESAALNDRCSTAEFHTRALQNSLSQANTVAEELRETLEATQHKAAGFEQGLGAAEIEIDNLRKGGEALEAALSTARLEHDMAQTVWRQRAKENRDEIATLEALVDAERSRADAGEHLLAEARAELSAKVADLRAKERHADELEVKIKPLEGQVEEARRAIGELEVKLSADEESRAKLADRAQALVRAMNDKMAQLDSADERAHLLKERLANETTQFAAESQQLEQKIHSLTEQLEKEKNARAVMSGALEASRSKVTRRPISSMRGIIAHTEDATSVDVMYPWPWSQKEGSESLQLASEAPEQEPAVERAVKSAQPSRGPELSLPKAKQLTVRRDKQRSDSRR